MATSEQYHMGRNRHAEPPPSPSRPKPKSKTKAKWNCTECTYLNEGKKKRCAMCLTPKPKAKHHVKAPSISVNNDNNHNNHNGYHHHNDNNSHQRQNSYHRKPGKGVQFSNNNNYDSPRSIASPSSQSTFFRTGPGRIPNGSIIPEDIVFNPHKPIAKQSIFERWMIAQIERQSGQQPAICVENNVILTNLRRVRAPTTFETLQRQINNNTDAMQHANNLDAGDFTDDEDEDEFSGGHSPRSPPLSPNSFNCTPTVDTEEDHMSSFSSYINAKKIPPIPNHSVSAVQLNGLNGYNNNNHNNNKNNKRPLPAIPQSARRAPDDGLNFDAEPNGVPRSKSYAEDASSMAYNQKKLLNGRRRKRTKHRKNQTVSELWFRAQSQLKQGRNPSILNRYNITLTNIRQHNPRFKDYQRRRSHHEKAATYLAVTGDKLKHTIDANKDIANDDDDYSDSDNDGHTPSSMTGNYGSYNAMVADNFLD